MRVIIFYDIIYLIVLQIKPTDPLNRVRLYYISYLYNNSVAITRTRSNNYYNIIGLYTKSVFNYISDVQQWYYRIWR